CPGCAAGGGRDAISALNARLIPLAYVDEMTGDRGRGGHRRRHQVGAALVALATLEIAVRGRGAALARREFVWVHGEAHGTAGLTWNWGSGAGARRWPGGVWPGSRGSKRDSRAYGLRSPACQRFWRSPPPRLAPSPSRSPARSSP